MIKDDLNKLLLGALVIKPDVLTFWNMRRELIERDIIDISKELLITKLILSSKSKSNETFAYRKWIIMRLLKQDNITVDYKTNLLNDEFAITEFTAYRSPNNYHAWSHRIWSIESIGIKFLSSFLDNQLDFSLNWIYSHVSEHAGYHYRQYLFNHVRRCPLDSHYMVKYNKVYDYLGINQFTSLTTFLLNKTDASTELDNYYCILLNELLCTLRVLNVTYPDHEVVWYHRRYILNSLLRVSCELLKIPWTNKFNFNCKVESNENITSVNLETSLIEYKFQDNGELHAKLFKCENNAIESTNLYKFLVKTETEFINEYTSTKYSRVQNFLAKRHHKWLRFILCIKDV